MSEKDFPVIPEGHEWLGRDSNGYIVFDMHGDHKQIGQGDAMAREGTPVAPQRPADSVDGRFRIAIIKSGQNESGNLMQIEYLAKDGRMHLLSYSHLSDWLPSDAVRDAIKNSKMSAP